MTDASPRQSLASIARALGVSTATVSNAFNKPERVSDELRARVLDHARKVGYVGPDPAARHLRRGRSDVVGLVFSDNLEFAFQDQASLGFLAGLSAACGASGRNLLMLAAGPPTASTGASIWRSPVSTAAMDGLIVYSVPQSDPHLLAALARALPVVVVDQPRNHPGVDWVGLDAVSYTHLDVYKRQVFWKTTSFRRSRSIAAMWALLCIMKLRPTWSLELARPPG